MAALPADPTAPALWIELFSMSTGWPARPTARIASLTLPWNVFPPTFKPAPGGPLLRKSARIPWLPLFGTKVVPVTVSGVPSARTPSAKVGPIVLPEIVSELPFRLCTPVVAYRMAALLMVPCVAARMVASVREPTRLMPPHSPAGSGDGHDCTKTDGQLAMLTLSRRLVKTFVPGFELSLALSAAPVRLIVPFDFTTLPAGTTRVPLLMFRSPLKR